MWHSPQFHEVPHKSTYNRTYRLTCAWRSRHMHKHTHTFIWLFNAYMKINLMFIKIKMMMLWCPHPQTHTHTGRTTSEIEWSWKITLMGVHYCTLPCTCMVKGYRWKRNYCRTDKLVFLMNAAGPLRPPKLFSGHSFFYPLRKGLRQWPPEVSAPRLIPGNQCFWMSQMDRSRA